MHEATLELNEKTDLIPVEVQCPTCHDKYFKGVPYVQVGCKKCGTSFKTDFNLNIYDKIAKRLDDLQAFNDKITVRATERYRPYLMHIKENHKAMKSWDVEELNVKNEEYRYCLNCGICLNCFQCKECGNSFTKHEHRRRQVCPECKETNFQKTYFTNAKNSEKTKGKICSECNSSNIKLTRTTNKSRCHKCKSTKLTEGKSNTIYTIIISRKRGYEI